MLFNILFYNKTVDLTGLEPATSSVQVTRSSQMSYRPINDIMPLTKIQKEQLGRIIDKA